VIRVGISGVGAVSAAGLGADCLWRAARDGVSGISELSLPRGEGLHVRLAGQVPDFEAAADLPAAVARRCDRFTQFAHVAVAEALRQAGLADAQLDGPRTAVVVGTSIGGTQTIDDGTYDFYRGHRLNPLAIPTLIPSAVASHLSITHGVTGPCFVVSSACSSAGQAIGTALQLIRAGLVDRVIAGGAEACITPVTVKMWEMLRVLSPDRSRPFCSDRNGMTLGEGAGALILESEAALAARGATPLAWLAGYGTSSDARDIVQPDLDGAVAAIEAALADAGLSPAGIDYINAHGTGTVLNDANEAAAIHRVFGARAAELPVSSTKPVIGHTFGASGALELIVAIGALREKVVPPQINITTPDPKCALFLPPVAAERPLAAVLSNSFAFGGINACLVVTAAAP
jgi:nodulation protein E